MTSNDLINLLPFCGTEPERPYLHAPFSQGDFTYATNGHIIIRVARRDDVMAQDKPDASRVFIAAGDKPHMGTIIERYNINLADEECCDICEGSGVKHDCPDCRCTCINCDGAGKYVPATSMEFRGGILKVRYYTMISSLPDAAMPVKLENGKPNWFTFNGGDGLVVSMTRPYENHLSKADLELHR